MDHALLRKWLSLPAGPWPPPHRALLGLPDGPVDAATAERNALARMEQLRPHQLVHPELVTEGMNRLAQALIAVTSDPATFAPLPKTQTRKRAKKAEPEFTFAPAAASAAAILEPDVLDAEVVDAPPRPPMARPLPPPPLAKPLLAEPDPTYVLLDDPVVEPLSDTLPAVGPDRTARRLAYRRLAFLRQLARLWDTLPIVFGAPSEPVRSALSVFTVLTGGREWKELRRLNPTFADGTGPGRAVRTVLAQPHAVTILREMTVSQRARLAADWAAGRNRIATELAAVRAALNAERPKKPFGRHLARLWLLARRNPEWVLVVLAVAVLLAGFLRPTG